MLNNRNYIYKKFGCNCTINQGKEASEEHISILVKLIASYCAPALKYLTAVH